MPSPDLALVRDLLERDILRSIVTLKMMKSYANVMRFRLVQDGSSWALLSLLPVSAYPWDRTGYAEAKFAVFLDGDSAQAKMQLLRDLPDTNLIIKTADDVVRDWAACQPNAVKTATFVSFAAVNWHRSVAVPGQVRQSAIHEEEVWDLFRMNGYETEELEEHFKSGAQWLGSFTDGRLAAACFVFQNYENVWEIGGVNTRAEFRRKGFGKAIVETALDFLLGRGLIPRYQAKWDNTASIRLAESCGLSEYMRVDHFFLRRSLKPLNR